MNTYEIFIYIGFDGEWVQITGNTPQEAVDSFRRFSCAPFFEMRDAVTHAPVVNWE